MAYPKYLYHEKEGARLLKCEAEEKALGAGWVDSPDKCKKVAPKKSVIQKLVEPAKPAKKAKAKAKKK